MKFVKQKVSKNALYIFLEIWKSQKKLFIKKMILIVTVLTAISLIACSKCRDQNVELATIRFGLEFTKVT